MKIMTSTVNLETQVKEVLGIVGAQYVVAINVAKDITVVFKDITGGRISGYEAEINEARQTCCNEMSESAQKKGADAVLGVSFELCSVGKGSILVVSCSGTAVKL
ncbi:hypothetical protein A4R63_00675 [Corynebacterium pseudotuberculosis]|uniref:YbjQ family protein n=1 Tax=Corynebacterium pseudotuberculosis TaxID=1719 RepID=UPI0008F88F57|nr:heavy metal-binding domain-containing protein [Corynebacterium pseudotuberculosis]AKN59563.2 heavy metal-binding domain-containing protein [Corynebacterium pseudotuberculosis 31]APB10086.1 hypothetical protein A4R72_00675 [Corynebacterium pseudotuberculosis]APB12132.1 hypothetical protein A4R71_00680 [Corynebacterium pseudotuberculosis]APB14179.1 hypothetical protein A4R68_00675 [Corynebacterium pseudotuberculosis]APB16230.1 hypothetical protein A4R67_00680 [Corynebacterium pseudotuberculos